MNGRVLFIVPMNGSDTDEFWGRFEKVAASNGWAGLNSNTWQIDKTSTQDDVKTAFATAGAEDLMKQTQTLVVAEIGAYYESLF